MIRLHLPHRKHQDMPGKPTETRLFRRFFDLIERLERPFRKPEPEAPEVKARITRLDAGNS